ncbi:MAG: FUSC family protein [Pseudonocardiaceae bacterium]
MATPRDVSRRLRDALVASDPGLLRLRLAGTATASMVASLGVMTGIARLTGQPITAVLLGVIVSMVAAISVNDPEPGAQRRTTVLLPVPAAAAVSLGTLLAGHRIVADVVFVAIMVVAVYVRRFGPRATALGQVGFQSYFFTQFLGASPSRWYWAVITAFIVFTNTTSLGEILSRGWQRIVGTLAGVVAGIGVAVAVGGNTVASLVTLFCCVFLGFYVLRVSQGLFMFWVTTVLALLYGLLGRFSIDVLVLRLEETAAGAVIGIAVAFLVLPSSTRDTVSGHVAEFLSGLDDLLDVAIRDLAGGGDAGAQRLLARARKLDQTVLTLRTAARPLTTGLAGLSGRGGFRRTMRTLAACDRYARGLARLATQAPGSPEPARLALTRAADAVRANVRALRALLGQPPDPPDRVELADATELLDAAEDLAADAEHAAAVRFLRRLDGAVSGLAIDCGAPRPSAPSSAART